jgi:hypothetical protein
MASEWAEEADGKAAAYTRQLAAAHGAAVELGYQRREARFALRGTADGRTHYFSVHDYQNRKGDVDWRRLRADVLARAAAARADGEGAAPADPTPAP